MNYFIKTMGCQMNVADSEAMAMHLAARGMRATDDRSFADVIVLNTCTVREDVECKAMAFIGRLKALKEKNPRLNIIVAGCAAQRAGQRLRKKFPFIDGVIGAADSGGFPSLCDSLFGVSDETHPAPVLSPVSAFVTVMRGCDNFCSYCIVPHVRGRERSRAAEDIVADVRALAQSGVRDVTLLGQNVNSYAGAGSDGGMIDFPSLLEAVAAVDGIRRVRFTTSHPKDLSDALIRVIERNTKICKHLHLPLQSGSDRVLKAMNRTYTADDYRRLAAKVRTVMPAISLTTDIMVGFPGETDEDFRDTLRLVETAAFNALFAYAYSPREGTASFSLKDDVPRAVKEERLNTILSAASAISTHINARLTDTVHEVLVEKKEERFCAGRTDGNTKVYFFSDDPGIVPGAFVRVKITRPRITTLAGEVV